MKRTILTQDGDFINYDYVKKIVFYTGTAEIADENNSAKTVTAVQIMAVMNKDNSEQEEILLGVYEENYFLKIYENLKKWLNEKND